METTIWGLACRPLINKPPPLNRDYNRDPHIKTLKRPGLLIMGLQYLGGSYGFRGFTVFRISEV